MQCAAVNSPLMSASFVNLENGRYGDVPAQALVLGGTPEQQKLLMALSTLNGGMWDWNIETGDVAFSSGWMQMLGYEPGSLPPTLATWQSRLHPDDASNVTQRIRDYLDGVAPNYQSEHRLRHSDGRWIWVLDRGQVLARTSEDRPLRMIGTEVDISELKRAEQVIRESEERYRLLVENLPEAVFVHHDGVFSYVNPATLHLLGVKSAAELIGSSIMTYVHPDFHEMVRRRIDSIKQTGLPNPAVEMKLVRKDQSSIHIEARATPCIFQGKSGIQVVCHDITDRHMAARRLRQAHDELDIRVQTRTAELELVNQSLRDEILERKKTEKKLRIFEAAFEHARDAVVILAAPLDPHGVQVLYANPSFARLSGYLPGEIVGRTSIAGTYFEEMILRLKYEDKFFGETVGRRKDGSEFSLEWSVSPVLDEWGETTEYVTIQRDATVRKETEESARKHHEELCHVLRQVTLGEMGTILAHELNQPLAAINNFAHGALLRMEGGHAPSDQIESALKQVIAQAGRAGEIIKRIRRFVRKSDYEFREIDLGDLVAETIQMLSSELRQHDVIVKIYSAENIARVVGDSIQVEQVLINLVRNAVTALQECEHPRQVSIVTRQIDAEFVEVEVRDNGHGISPTAREKIFEPFFTTRSEGLGMGLSISRAIVEAHGGKLWLASESNQGASFQFTLPAQIQRLSALRRAAGPSSVTVSQHGKS